MILLSMLFLLSAVYMTTSAFAPSFGARRPAATRLFGETSNKDSSSGFYDELKRRIVEETSNPYADLFHGATVKHAYPGTVHIVSFQPGTENQGIHSIEYPKNSGNNVILAFESKAACDKFADDLRAQHFFDPTTQELSLDTLSEFCETLGVYVQVIPAGFELTPPQQNVEQIGQHNRALKDQQNHLNYVFAMEDGGFEEDGMLLWEGESTFQ